MVTYVMVLPASVMEIRGSPSNRAQPPVEDPFIGTGGCWLTGLLLHVILDDHRE